MGSGASQSYKLKDTTGKFNVNKNKYNEDQIKFIQEQNAEILYYFGYTNHPSESNPTAFFEFKEHKPEHVAKYYGFKQDIIQNDYFIIEATS